MSVPHLIAMIGGAVCLLFSFFDFLGRGDFGESAWGDGLFPIATYVAVIGLLVALELALTAFANVQLPATMLGFTRSQLRLALAFFATLIMVGFLILETFGSDKKIGFWFMLLGSIAMLVGSIMERTMTNVKTVSFGGAPGSPPPPPPGSSPPPPPPPR